MAFFSPYFRFLTAFKAASTLQSAMGVSDQVFRSIGRSVGH